MLLTHKTGYFLGYLWVNIHQYICHRCGEQVVFVLKKKQFLSEKNMRIQLILFVDSSLKTVEISGKKDEQKSMDLR